jgi:23S rRNA (cytidine1920-2'-O)/16S rRNA (cytidine1409-2'-O)-methyltransferase
MMTSGKKKVRIDVLLADRGLAESRTRAQALLMAGKVFVDGRRVDKAGAQVDPDSEITVKEGLPYVGRGGLKLAGALDGFSMDVEGLAAVDVGSSTGGFTDCLLKRGARHVYAIDVGKGLIDQRLRDDDRVTLFEGRNVRFMSPGDLPEQVDLAVIDVSFISLEKVLPAVVGFLRPGAEVLALVKPQFEVGPADVGKGGIVRDPEKQAVAVAGARDAAATLGLAAMGEMESPVKGAKGNREFWLRLRLERA